MTQVFGVDLDLDAHYKSAICQQDPILGIVSVWGAVFV